FVQSTVRCAVLSHQWVDSEEFSYEDMMKNKTTGSGHAKIQRFCEKATSNDLEFAWADACCINKSSSTELDKSFRLIFRWYQNSLTCIVHLAQTTTLGDARKEEWLEMR
ncbi:uncharacterized protein EDB91DRAFT_1060055, partial [Suillus paluster]|uniref:uncharacterized protein n=1 Tax=Suillus paluster TaxID=48578 RepID=UPI001B886E76